MFKTVVWKIIISTVSSNCFQWNRIEVYIDSMLNYYVIEVVGTRKINVSFLILSEQCLNNCMKVNTMSKKLSIYLKTNTQYLGTEFVISYKSVLNDSAK